MLVRPSQEAKMWPRVCLSWHTLSTLWAFRHERSGTHKEIFKGDCLVGTIKRRRKFPPSCSSEQRAELASPTCFKWKRFVVSALF